MAYEAEKNRLAQLLTDVVGIQRTRDSDLEREATERGLEARMQTGLNSGSIDGPDAIVHPTAAQRQLRLGVPPTVGTAELATWNYLYHDPVHAAAQGLLNSADHRAVLDNSAFDHWGIGIHTAMPEGETSELLRRWWFIIWLATEPIGAAVMTQPSEFLDKRVSFGSGTHYGYQFDYQGKILATKTLKLTQSSGASTKGRGSIPGRAGKWLLIRNGYFEGYWVMEGGFVAQLHTKLV